MNNEIFDYKERLITLMERRSETIRKAKVTFEFDTFAECAYSNEIPFHAKDAYVFYDDEMIPDGDFFVTDGNSTWILSDYITAHDLLPCAKKRFEDYANAIRMIDGMINEIKEIIDTTEQGGIYQFLSGAPQEGNDD